MTQKLKGSKQVQFDEEQLPSGVLKEDWMNTPVSIRKFVVELLVRKKPKTHIPLWVMVFINILIFTIFAFLLNKVVIFPCVTPLYVSSLSVALILLTAIHLLWRYIYPEIRRHAHKGYMTTVTFGALKLEVDQNILFAILNEIHPWKISGRILGIVLLVFFGAGVFLNLSPYSPYRGGGGPFVIQGFSVQRLNSSLPEYLALGETLMLKADEKVILEVALLGDTQVSCTWYVASSSQNFRSGCSVVYSAQASIKHDVLSVFIQPACGLRQESTSLHVAVQP